MESEWNSVLFTVMLYKDTNTFILKNTDEASQLLDDHIVMIQSMSFSPFKKAFEERMNTWENKLKMTQVLVSYLHTCGEGRQLGCAAMLEHGRCAAAARELGGQLSRKYQSLKRKRGCQSPLTLVKERINLEFYSANCSDEIPALLLPIATFFGGARTLLLL